MNVHSIPPKKPSCSSQPASPSQIEWTTSWKITGTQDDLNLSICSRCRDGVADELRDARGNFALREVAYSCEFDAFVASGKPSVLAFGGGGKIYGVSEAAGE